MRAHRSTPMAARRTDDSPPPSPRALGEELARTRTPLSDEALERFTDWVTATFGEDVMTMGTGEWLTVYRQPPR